MPRSGLKTPAGKHKFHIDCLAFPKFCACPNLTKWEKWFQNVLKTVALEMIKQVELERRPVTYSDPRVLERRTSPGITRIN